MNRVAPGEHPGPLAPPILQVQGRRYPGTRSTWVAWLLLGGMVLAIAVLYVFPPAEHGFYPRCGLYTLTGLHCPGCGSLRALHHLSHGRWLEALDSNALLVFGLAAGLGTTITSWWRGGLRRWSDWFLRPAVPVALLLVLIGFGVARNLPWAAFQWLAP